MTSTPRRARVARAHRPVRLATVAAAALLVAACGGGGGGDATPTPNVPVTPAASTLTASGTAAKGLMRNAVVTAHAVKADGSVDGAELARTTTADDGRYTLPAFTVTPGAVYVVRVAAQAGTEHLDETSGAWQPVPSTFTMRSTTVAGTETAQTRALTLTPFSEMAVAAAARASGGLTAANVEQGRSTVRQLLGFDPTSTPVERATDGAASADGRRLATLLTAVSKLAATSALECTDADAGARTACVVGKLAAATEAGTMKLAAGTTDVSAALSGALTSVVAADNRALVAAVQANLGCSGSTCATAPAGTTPTAPGTTALAIAEAKTLFAQLKADVLALASPGGTAVGATGGLNLQAAKFQRAFDATRWPVDTVGGHARAMATAAQLWADFTAGRTTNPNSVSAMHVAGPAGGSSVTTGCTVYTDATTSTVATTAASAGVVACTVPFWYERTSTATTVTTTMYRHSVVLAPTADADRFTFATRARKTVNACPTAGGTCTRLSNDNLMSVGGNDRTFDGTITFGRDASGALNALRVKGDLPPSFEGRQETTGTALVGDHISVDLDAGFTRDGGAMALTLRPSIVVTYKDATTADATIALAAGSLAGVATSSSAGLSAASIDLTVRTAAGAEFQGVLAASDAVWDASHTLLQPTRLSFGGALRTTEAGVTTEFVRGKFSVATSGFGAWNASLASGATNRYDVAWTFEGSVTAPGRPQLDVTASATKPHHASETTTASGQLRSSLGGTARSSFNLTTARNATGTLDFTLAETASGLALAAPNGAATASLSKSGTVIGVLDLRTKILTFTDGSFISLDLGL